MKHRRLDAASMVLLFVFLSFWAAVIASTLDGPRWMAATVLSVVFFVTAVLWLYHGLVAPRRRR